MGEIMKINQKLAIDDPEKVFAGPHVIVQHIGLTRGQKIAALDSWSFAVSARLNAANEGMTAESAAAYDRDTELHRQIERARLHLDEVARESC